MKKTLLLITLGVCICVLSAFLGIKLISENLPKEPLKNNGEIVKVNVNEKINKEEDIIKEENNEIINTSIEPVEEIREFALVYPVEGEIGLGYSPENLIYSKTLQEWITHKGIDIKAARGTPVKASESGKVENITETADKGIEITISHENNYKTIYSNLSTRDMVKVGDYIAKGQVISGIGNTSSFEYYEPDHLHFEVKKDGKYVNPLDVLKK